MFHLYATCTHTPEAKRQTLTARSPPVSWEKTKHTKVYFILSCRTVGTLREETTHIHLFLWWTKATLRLTPRWWASNIFLVRRFDMSDELLCQNINQLLGLAAECACMSTRIYHRRAVLCPINLFPYILLVIVFWSFHGNIVINYLEHSPLPT